MASQWGMEKHHGVQHVKGRYQKYHDFNHHQNDFSLHEDNQPVGLGILAPSISRATMLISIIQIGLKK